MYTSSKAGRTDKNDLSQATQPKALTCDIIAEKLDVWYNSIAAAVRKKHEVKEWAERKSRFLLTGL